MSGNINFNGWINDDGSENYKCRAWVNFNGTGTVAIRDSGNVSSITDNGTGDYTVNFTTAMPDANYSAVYGRMIDGSAYPGGGFASVATYLSTGFTLRPQRDTGGNNIDSTIVTVAVFR